MWRQLMMRSFLRRFRPFTAVTGPREGVGVPSKMEVRGLPAANSLRIHGLAEDDP